jgi:hypothetical protein
MEFVNKCGASVAISTHMAETRPLFKAAAVTYDERYRRTGAAKYPEESP